MSDFLLIWIVLLTFVVVASISFWGGALWMFWHLC